MPAFHVPWPLATFVPMPLLPICAWYLARCLVPKAGQGRPGHPSPEAQPGQASLRAAGCSKHGTHVAPAALPSIKWTLEPPFCWAPTCACILAPCHPDRQGRQMQPSAAPFAVLSGLLPGLEARQAIQAPTAPASLPAATPQAGRGRAKAGGVSFCEPHLRLLPRTLLALVVVAPLLLLLLARLSPLRAVLGPALLPAVGIVRVV